MGKVIFTHDQVGSLVIDNGIDDAAWTYGLNTATFPTYGGEVVQILSVYIDDLTLKGTCATYAQMEAIYKYFVSYLQIATQGKNPTPNIGDSFTGQAYNLYPVHFLYEDRGWVFHLYPKSVPGFHFGTTVVTPTWQVGCHVVDDSPDIGLLKEGLKALHLQGNTALAGSGETGPLFTINGEISPKYGDPNADPFQTFDTSPALSQIQQYSDYYNSLIPKWMQGDFSSLTAGIGSQPNVVPSTTPTPGTNLNGVPAPPGAQTQSGHQPGNAGHGLTT